MDHTVWIIFRARQNSSDFEIKSVFAQERHLSFMKSLLGNYFMPIRDLEAFGGSHWYFFTEGGKSWLPDRKWPLLKITTTGHFHKLGFIRIFLKNKQASNINCQIPINQPEMYQLHKHVSSQRDFYSAANYI